VPDYHVYTLNRKGHIISSPRVIAADHDAAAIEQAKVLSQGHDFEIWGGGRLIARLHSNGDHGE
jgi:hypothetical protein